MNDTIHVEYELSFPPEKVWRVLTDPSLVSQWLMKTDIAATVGHKFTFAGPAMDDWDGRIDCEILEAEAPKKLRYSWRGGPSKSRLDSEVTWTLTPTAGGTRLALAHSGFLPVHAFAFDIMGKGWKKMVENGIPRVLAEAA